MALRTAGSVLVVFLWSVAVVLGQDGWSVKYTTQSICVLKGSTVELTCSYTYPSGYTVTTTFWFTKYNAVGLVSLSDDPDYKGRVTYRKDKENEHTLTITDLRESDSATYKFRFTDQTGKWRYTGEPGVTLSVTESGLQVKVTGGHQDKTLTCSTTCTLTDNPTYIWYKNGQHLDESTSPQYKDPVSSNYEDSYSCAVKGHEDLHSPAVCVQGQDCNRVSYTKRTICALKGSSVNISCTYFSLYNITSSLWFSPKQSDSWRDELIPEDLTTDPGYAGRVEFVGEKERGQSTVRITDLREEDSAEYKFIFNTQTSRWGHSFPGTTLTVTDLRVKVTPATEAGKRTLTCITTCTLTDNPTYIWYQNGHKVKEDTSRLDSDSFSDADSYSCAVKGHEDLLSPAVCQKCWSVTYTHQSICALKGTTVDISCSYTYPSYHEIKKAFWFTKWSGRDPEDLSSVPGYEGHIEYLGDKESDCTLRITDLRLSDSAGYRFRLITSGEMVAGSPVSLTVSDVVLEMDPTSVSDRENVTLRCRTNCTLDPITVYSWYKNGQPIPNSNTSSPVYILFSVSSEDTGRYSCSVEGHEDLPSAEEPLTVTYGPKNTSVSVSPSGGIVEGSSVTLTCSSDANPPVDIYTWYKKNVTSPKASGQSYSITNISSEDRGEYYCEASNIKGTETSIPVHINVMLNPAAVFPWVPVMGVGAVLTAGALLLTIYCTLKRRYTGESDATTDTQSVHPDCNSDTYTGLNMRTMSPDYDSLASVHSDPNSNKCTSLKKNTRSPE
ncbi:sialoadhesin-like isoform X1 [Oncorhynchus kisutch]|uniref:sialoadhesin-like isoform X1 n=1 Tax=Oncorhynchus kisutch TaxID=8019 RepID=UPI0012DE3704|nr:sialoadhesin-like isoform X1 [Oncorhynchus kisutch]XP_031676034.1 sialoadhesin-like isoform X1 [Oncorhynchus kisutch]